MRLFHFQITGPVTAVTVSNKRAKLGVFPGRENIPNSRKVCLRNALIIIYLIKTSGSPEAPMKSASSKPIYTGTRFQKT